MNTLLVRFIGPGDFGPGKDVELMVIPPKGSRVQLADGQYLRVKQVTCPLNPTSCIKRPDTVKTGGWRQKEPLVPDAIVELEDSLENKLDNYGRTQAQIAADNLAADNCDADD